MEFRTFEPDFNKDRIFLNGLKLKIITNLDKEGRALRMKDRDIWDRFNKLWDSEALYFQIQLPETVNVKIIRANCEPNIFFTIGSVALTYHDYEKITFLLCPTLDSLRQLDPPLGKDIFKNIQNKKYIVLRDGSVIEQKDIYAVIGIKGPYWQIAKGETLVEAINKTASYVSKAAKAHLMSNCKTYQKNWQI
ncbi:MAG: hypothetical protein FWE50_03255 [Alphaproteobacteria bacterium]|nr:hypothetical protein [Alphaproteobacteria bacterium]